MTKIAAPGIYDIPIEDYIGDCCVGPSISSSGLRELLPESGSCPAKYWAYSPLNPNRFPDESTQALDFGRAAHALALGEPEFAKYFIVSPYDDFRKKEARGWRDEQQRTVIKADDFETVKAIAAIQKRSAQCMRAFEDGRAEQSLMWKDEETDIWLKARPDWLPNDPAKRFVAEYKTCLSIEPGRLSNDVFKYGYHIQAGMQLDGIRKVMGVEPLGIAHVCQEKDPPYLVELRMFTPEQLADGYELYRHALRTFAHCLKTGDWPQYTTEPTYFESPYRHVMLMDRIRTQEGMSHANANGNKGQRYSAADYINAG